MADRYQQGAYRRPPLETAPQTLSWTTQSGTLAASAGAQYLSHVPFPQPTNLISPYPGYPHPYEPTAHQAWLPQGDGTFRQSQDFHQRYNLRSARGHDAFHGHVQGRSMSQRPGHYGRSTCDLSDIYGGYGSQQRDRNEGHIAQREYAYNSPEYERGRSLSPRSRLNFPTGPEQSGYRPHHPETSRSRRHFDATTPNPDDNQRWEGEGWGSSATWPGAPTQSLHGPPPAYLADRYRLPVWWQGYGPFSTFPYPWRNQSGYDVQPPLTQSYATVGGTQPPASSSNLSSVKADSRASLPNDHRLPSRPPSPSQEYLKVAHQEPTRLPPGLSQSLLVVLDLNGTLLRRFSKSNFVRRPRVDELLRYLFAHHQVMVWSSATPANVADMCAKLFTPAQQAQLLAVWARDTLQLSRRQYAEKVQVYKQLSWVWGDGHLQARHGGPARPPWGPENTVLVDDSEEKAKSEPFNLLRVHEFDRSPGAAEDDVCDAVVRYLEVLKEQRNVCAYMRTQPFASA